MNTRKLFFTALLIVALALGAGLILAQDDGGADEDKGAKTEHEYGRRGGFHHGRGFRGFGGPRMMLPGGFGMPGGAELMALVTGATGLEPDALRDALREGNSLAALIEANGGDAEAFIAEATDQATAQASARIAERVEAMVRGEHPAGKMDADARGPRKGGPRGFAGRAMGPLAGMPALALEATGLEPHELFSALRSGESPASLIEANDGDVEAFIAAISEAFNARLDEAVEAGRISEERAARLRQGMAQNLEAMVQGEFPPHMKDRAWRGWLDGDRHGDKAMDDDEASETSDA